MDSLAGMIHERRARGEADQAAAKNAGGESGAPGFLGSRKRFWLLPFLLVTLLLLAAVLLAKGPAIIPFIYRSF
jgi:hypothetical protein